MQKFRYVSLTSYESPRSAFPIFILEASQSCLYVVLYMSRYWQQIARVMWNLCVPHISFTVRFHNGKCNWDNATEVMHNTLTLKHCKMWLKPIIMNVAAAKKFTGYLCYAMRRYCWSEISELRFSRHVVWCQTLLLPNIEHHNSLTYTEEWFCMMNASLSFYRPQWSVVQSWFS